MILTDKPTIRIDNCNGSDRGRNKRSTGYWLWLSVSIVLTFHQWRFEDTGVTEASHILEPLNMNDILIIINI